MGDWIGITEAAYRLEGTDGDWVEGLCEQAAEPLDQDLGVAVHTFAIEGLSLRTLSVAVRRAHADLAEAVRRSNAGASPEGVEAFLGHGASVQTMSEAVFAASPEDYEPFQRNTGAYSADVLGVLCLAGGRGVSISIPLAESRPAAPAERRRLGRIGAHLAAGLRLRAALAQGLDLEDEGIEAVLEPDGRVRELRGAARSDGPKERLRDAVRRIDRARSRRDDPEALGLWEGLVRGRWSLLDHFDSDGRRFVVARRNAPELGDPKGLSEREQQVAEYIGRGQSNKEIAYSFGITESAVSNAASRAARKLGLGSRVELAAFFAPGGLRARLARLDVAGEPLLVGSVSLFDPQRLQALAPAEQEVTALLLAGATNADIARRRGTSEHTVANQVRAVFGRFSVNSRVELAAVLQASA